MGRCGQGQCEVSAWWPQLYCRSFTAAVHIGWYHRCSKHWRKTGNGTQHTNRSAVGWLLRYPHLLSPPVRSCRAGRWLTPAHVLSETHAAILFRKFPLELYSIHTLVHPGYGCKSTTSYQGGVSHRWAYLSTCNWGMECCLRRSIRRGEEIYIRYGKSKGGLMGISLSADQVAGWVLSHHMCDTLALAMDEMFVDRVRWKRLKAGKRLIMKTERRSVKNLKKAVILWIPNQIIQSMCQMGVFPTVVWMFRTLYRLVPEWWLSLGQASLITFTNQCQNKWPLWCLWRRASQLVIGRFMTLKKSNLGC